MFITSAKDYFQLLGWKDSDVLSTSFSTPENAKSKIPLRISDFQNAGFETEAKKNGWETYYSPVAIDGAVKELIFSGVDFIGLPEPTVLIKHNGVSYAHYRLENADDYDKAAKRLKSYYRGRLMLAVKSPMPFTAGVEIVSCSDKYYTLDDFAKLIPDDWAEPVKQKLTVKTCPKSPELVIEAKKWLKKMTGAREEKAKAVITKLIFTYPTISDCAIMATLKQLPCYACYNNDKSAAKKDIIQIRIANAASLKSKLPAEKVVNPAGYDLSHLDSVRNIFDKAIFDTRQESKFNITLAILDQLYKANQSALLSLPCASGKTFSALICAASIASPGTRLWIVSEKIEDCKRNAKILQDLGCSAVAFHGRDSVKCKHKSNMTFWQNRKALCSACQNKCGAELKYLSNDKWDHKQADIICCTHTHYKMALGADAIPDDLRLIIIDESPNLLEQFSFKEKDLGIIDNLLIHNRDLSAIFSSDIHYNIREPLIKGGGRKVKPLNLPDYKKEILAYAFRELDKDFITESEAGFVLEFLTFFQSNNVYGFKQGDSYSFMTGQVNVSSKVQTIILDGSARNQSTCWQGFKLIECDALKQSYPNTIITVLSHNPSQAKLQNEAVFNELKDLSLQAVQIGETALVFSNKDSKIMKLIDQLINDLSSKTGKDVIYLRRGQHIGSNAGRAATHTVICMSLFTDVSDYVLRACVYNDKEIPAEEIFNSNGSPRFDKAGKWSNAMIQEQYLKQVERDLYQAILRGIIRDNPQAVYHVICLGTGTDIIATLQDDLEGAKIDMPDEKIIDLYLQGKTEQEIETATGIKHQSVSESIAAFQKLLRGIYN